MQYLHTKTNFRHCQGKILYKNGYILHRYYYFCNISFLCCTHITKDQDRYQVLMTYLSPCPLCIMVNIPNQIRSYMRVARIYSQVTNVYYCNIMIVIVFARISVLTWEAARTTEEITFTARPKINSHSQIFRYSSNQITTSQIRTWRL